MKHFTSPRFWQRYHRLPASIQQVADKQSDLLKQNPSHPSLRLKSIGRRYRAVAVEHEGNLLWFWIGSHAEYEKLINGYSGQAFLMMPTFLQPVCWLSKKSDALGKSWRSKPTTTYTGSPSR